MSATGAGGDETVMAAYGYGGQDEQESARSMISVSLDVCYKSKEGTYTEKTPRLTAVMKETLKMFPLLQVSTG